VLLRAVHLAATAYLAGLVWVVQLVVYPGFRLVGPTERWAGYHARHTTAISYAVGPAWLAQAVTVAALLLTDPSPLVLLAAALAATTLVVTVAVSVPLHTRLGQAYDDAVAARLVSTNWLRTAAWTAGAAVAVALVVTGPS
jgi:hypothetical protein